MTSRSCPDCGTAMESGYVPDHAHGSVRHLAWYPAEPQNLHILGFKTGSLKPDYKRRINITTFRCPDCGLLRFYAKR